MWPEACATGAVKVIAGGYKGKPCKDDGDHQDGNAVVNDDDADDADK